MTTTSTQLPLDSLCARLEDCVTAIASTDRIKAVTKEHVLRQATVFAAFLTDLLGGHCKVDLANRETMLSAIEAFCEAVQDTLQPISAVEGVTS